MAPSHPLRLAIIGLSANAATSWASAAHLPGLLSARGKNSYNITALLNSSVDAAKAAIKTYNLPSETKAYGDPQDLANDKDIDAVICAVRVDKHYETVLPSIKAGKKVFIEWPIAANKAEREELLNAAKEARSLVAIGLQGRWVPVTAKVKELVQSGRFGKVLSSDIRAFGGTMGRDIVPPGLKYFTEWKVGGNPIIIGFGHMIDFTLSSLGDLKQGSTHAKTQIQWKENKVVDPKTKEIVEKTTTDVPDLISVLGQLVESQYVAHDASFSVKFRRGQQFPGEPALTWHINLEKGEIRLKAMSGTSLQASGYDIPPEIQCHHFDTNEVEDVPWEWSKEQLALPIPARGVIETLLAFGDDKSEGWVDIEQAAHRAEQIEAWVTKGQW